MIVILDYGIGNIRSIQSMIYKAGGESIISADPLEIAKASKFILPGIGSFDHGISNLRAAPYFDLMEKMVLQNKVPLLGVCLGLQLLSDSSEEGTLRGLGWIRGAVKKLDQERIKNVNLKIPHMGWSEVMVKKETPLLKGMYAHPRFYFVHSYHFVCERAEDEFLSAEYGYQFTAGAQRENIMGVQFHPEKSHKYGLKLYENFVNYY